VAAGLAVLIALPPVMAALPARERGVTADALLSQIRASSRAGYSGYAEAVGGLRLPLTDEFAPLADLFGGRTRLRVWWRGEHDWRVDAIEPTGESGLHRDAVGAWTWDYEENQVWRIDERDSVGRPPNSVEASLRLPRPADLEPAQLGRRLLAEATAREISRLPARRIAGRDAPGLRLRPDDPGTTITSVDVWADPGTGAPIRVDVTGRGANRPVVAASYLEFDPRPPSEAVTRFAPPARAKVSYGQLADLAADIDLFGSLAPPDELAGYRLRRQAEGLGVLGTYGRGVGFLAAVPLPDQVSWPLRDQLRRTRGVRAAPAGLQLSAGPLSLLLTDDTPGGRHWLLTGTVTAETLQRAAADLAARPLEPR
jgi:hypothetical protein